MMPPSYSIQKSCCATTYIEGVSTRSVKDRIQLRWSLDVNQQGIKLLANLKYRAKYHTSYTEVTTMMIDVSAYLKASNFVTKSKC